MPSRRQIREAAIQFLYCSDLEGGADPATLREPFWLFLTESDRRNLLSATLRTLQHLAHGRDLRLSEFIDRCENSSPHLAAIPDAESLLSLLNRLRALESSWSIAYSALQRIPKSGDDGDLAEELQTNIDHFLNIDRDLSFHRKQFLKATPDFPSLKPHLEALSASIRRLDRISDRIRMVENPENFPEQADLAKIRDSKADLAQLIQHTDSLVDSILSNKPAIDSTLASIVENFSPERIDPVDRAVLRLATYELLKTDTPPKVIINEAIELAKRFGTTDSNRFVNGILDSVAKITGSALS